MMTTPIESSLASPAQPAGARAPVVIAVLALVAVAAADCAHRSMPAESLSSPLVQAAVPVAAAPAAGAAAVRSADRPPLALSGGAPSIDALLDDFMDAVERNDAAALHRLRVTKAEFQQIIIPGSVPKGQAPRQVSDKPREFFWALNDSKSRYFAQAMLAQFGGRGYVDRQVSFTKGTREYAWYTAHGQVQLALHTADDRERPLRLRTGTIAELDGQYKFISFQWEE